MVSKVQKSRGGSSGALRAVARHHILYLGPLAGGIYWHTVAILHFPSCPPDAVRIKLQTVD